MYLVEVGKWLLISHHHLRELCPLLRIDPHHVPEEKDVVWGVVDFLGIENDLLELPCLCKTLDHLHTHREREWALTGVKEEKRGEEKRKCR